MIVLIGALAVIEALVLVALVCEWVTRRLREPVEYEDTSRGTLPRPRG